MRRFFIPLVAFSLAVSNVAVPLAALAVGPDSSAPTFLVSAWRDGQTKVVLTFSQGVANGADAALDAADFEVSGTQSIAISSVEHDAGGATVLLTLAAPANSTEADFLISCAADAVVAADGGSACDSSTDVSAYALPEETTGPVVSDSYPTNGQTDVPVVTDTVFVTFGDAIDASTLTGDSVRLMRGLDVIPTVSSYSLAIDAIVVVIDGGALDPFEEYRLELLADPTAGAVSNVSGLSLADTDATADGVQTIVFTTGEADTTAPTVSFATATQGSLFVSFGEPMDESSAEDLSGYALESPDGTAIPLSSLGGHAASYDSWTYTTEITGVALAVGDSFSVVVSGVTDLSGNAIDAAANAASGIVIDEGDYDPGSHSYSGEAGDMPSGFSAADFGYVPQASAWPSSSLAGFSASYYVYVPIASQIPSAGEGGSVVVTFPSGTDVSGAHSPSESWSNEDANFGSPGTIAVRSMSVNEDARTVTVDFTEATRCDDGNAEPCLGDANDSVNFEIAGIVNPTVAGEYSAEVRTMDGSELLSNVVSYPFSILAAGDSVLTVNLTAAGAEEGTATIHGWGSATGTFDLVSSEFSGGAAIAEMNGIPDGDYYLWTDSTMDLNGDSEDDYIGVTMPSYVTVSGDTVASMTFFSVGDMASLDVHVTGAIGKDVDVTAYGPSSASDSIGSTSGDDTVELHLQDGEWWIYVWPHYDGSSGYVTPDYVSPQPVYVSVQGGEIASEASGTPNDGTVEMDLVATDNEIPFLAVDQDGLPVANAWISVSDSTGGFWNYGQTSVDGTVTLPVSSGSFHASLYVEGMPQSQERTVIVNEDGAIFLDGSDVAVELVTLVARIPTNAISGTVSDGTNPVSGASVYAFCTEGCVGNSYSWASTDVSGSFTFFVDNGSWQVGAYLPGFGNALEQTVSVLDAGVSDLVIAPDPDAVFRLIEGTVCQSAEGELDCAGGEGLQGVWLYASSGEPGGGSNYGTTSADGTYSLRVPAAAGYDVQAWDPTLGELVGLGGIDASSGDVAGADIVVVDPETVVLRVVDADGNPYADGSIYGEAKNAAGGKRHFSIQGTDSTTLSLSPGSYQFSLYSNEAGLGSDDIASDSADTTFAEGVLVVDGTEALVIAMPELFAVSGTVTDGDGNPLVSAWVEILDTASSQYAGGVTDDAGEYSIRLEAGTYQGTAYYPGLIMTPAEVVVDGDTVADFSGAIADRTISGSISVGDAPLPFAYVKGVEASGTVASAASDADGAFSLPVIDGTWSLTAVGYGYAEGDAVVSEVSGEDVAGIALTVGDVVDLSDPMSVSVTPSAGGTVQNDDAGVDVVIPANALGTSSSSSNSVTLTETNSVVDTETSSVVGNGIEVDVTDSTGTAVTQFNDDLTYTWTMTVEELAAEGIDTRSAVEDLTISYFDSSGSWIAGSTTVTFYGEDDSVVADPAEDLSDVSYVELIAAFDHTTLFAVTTSNDAVSEEEDAPPADNGNGGGGGGSSNNPSSGSYDSEDSVDASAETTADAEAEEADAQIGQIVAESVLSYLQDADSMAVMMGSTQAEASETLARAAILKNISDAAAWPSDATVGQALLNFVAYGTPSTRTLGSGERAGALNSYRAAFGAFPETADEWEDALKIAGGRWPSERSEAAEATAVVSFKTIYLRDADMANANDNAAVTVMAYGLRPSARSLASEAVAIGYFRDILGSTPDSAADWDVVRAIAYSGATR